MDKKRRHQRILDLISTKTIGRQDELAHLLTENGFGVTQASVSRDLDELRIAKVNGRYVSRSAPVLNVEYGNVSLTAAGDNLIVVRCASGLASAAAVRIDSAGIPEIVGTIAGDDTIFVAVGHKADQALVTRSIRRYLGIN